MGYYYESKRYSYRYDMKTKRITAKLLLPSGTGEDTFVIKRYRLKTPRFMKFVYECNLWESYN